jgi:hypothetical protein
LLQGAKPATSEQSEEAFCDFLEEEIVVVVERNKEHEAHCVQQYYAINQQSARISHQTNGKKRKP